MKPAAIQPLPDILAALVRDVPGFSMTSPPEPLQGGNLNYVWRLKRGETTWILKHAPSYIASQPDVPLSPTRLTFEARALELFEAGGRFETLANDSLRPPRLLLWNPDRSFLLMEDAGEGPGFALALAGGSLSPDLGHALGAFIGRLHRGSTDDAALARAFDNHGIQETRLHVQYLAVAALARAAGIDLATVAKIQVNATALGQRLLLPGRCLVMGDLWPRSLLVADGALRVIDWEFAHFGHALQDVAHFGAHCWMQAHTAVSVEIAQRWWALWEHFVVAYREAWPSAFSATDESLLRIHAGAEIIMRAIGPFAAGYCYEGRTPGDVVIREALDQAVQLLVSPPSRNKPAPEPSHLHMTSFRLPLLCFAALTAFLPATLAFDQTHAALEQILKQNVRGSLVNYAALKAAPAALDGYLAQSGAVNQAEFDSWTKSERLAFLINLYNATTLKLIADNYPVKSIRSIGWLPGAAWKKETVSLFGRKISLDELEHGIIRKAYAEPRAHFALVCAALGCPPLREEAFVGARLDAQLDDQGRRFLGNEVKNRVEDATHVVYLSPIFKWFAEDFEGAAGTVLKFVTPFFPETARIALGAGGEFKIEFTDYDWSLNDQAKK